MNRLALLAVAGVLSACGNIPKPGPVQDNVASVVALVQATCGFEPELAALALLIGAGNTPGSIAAEICDAVVSKKSAERGGKVTVVVRGVTVQGRFK